jgi:hypothetical protein
MKHALVFCMILFSLNGTGIDASLKDKQTCSMGIAPRLQAYCVKKTKKEKLRCQLRQTILKRLLTTLYALLIAAF